MHKYALRKASVCFDKSARMFSQKRTCLFVKAHVRFNELRRINLLASASTMNRGLHRGRFFGHIL